MDDESPNLTSLGVRPLYTKLVEENRSPESYTIREIYDREVELYFKTHDLVDSNAFRHYHAILRTWRSFFPEMTKRDISFCIREFTCDMSGKQKFIFNEAKARVFSPHPHGGLSLPRKPVTRSRKPHNTLPSPRDGGYYLAYTMFYGRTELYNVISSPLGIAPYLPSLKLPAPESLLARRKRIKDRELFVGSDTECVVGMKQEAKIQMSFQAASIQYKGAQSAGDNGKNRWAKVTDIYIRVTPLDPSPEALARANFARSALWIWLGEADSMTMTKEFKYGIDALTFYLRAAHRSIARAAALLPEHRRYGIAELLFLRQSPWIKTLDLPPTEEWTGPRGMRSAQLAASLAEHGRLGRQRQDRQNHQDRQDHQNAVEFPCFTAPRRPIDTAESMGEVVEEDEGEAKLSADIKLLEMEVALQKKRIALAAIRKGKGKAS